MLGLLGATALLATTLVSAQPRDLTEPAAARVAASSPPRVSIDLPYVADNDPAHRLDLFVPGGYKTPRPLVVFIHGGSWSHGSKSVIVGGSGQRTEAFRDLLLQAGYAVASVEYRFSQVARFPAQLHDVKAGVRFLRAHADRFNLDPTRFAVAGESAGGHLADLVGFTGPLRSAHLEGDLGETGVSSAVSAVVSYYGVSDLSRVVPDRLAARCPRGEDGASSPEGRVIGGDPESPHMRRVVRRANPVSYVGVTSPPTLLLHGSRDCLVPPRQSTRLLAMLRGFGIRSEYIVLDAPHGGPAFHTTPRVTAQVLAFLDENLAVER